MGIKSKERMSMNDYNDPFNKTANEKNNIFVIKKDSKESLDLQQLNDTNKSIQIKENPSQIGSGSQNGEEQVATSTQPKITAEQASVGVGSADNVKESINSNDNQSMNRVEATTPLSHSNMTFLSGSGFFDWSQSALMEDVTNAQEKFKRPSNVDEEVDIYTEEEIYEMVDQIKESQKSLRDYQKLKAVFNKSLDTLRVLM